MESPLVGAAPQFVLLVPEPLLKHPLLQTQVVPMENLSQVSKSSLFPGTHDLGETLWQMCLQNLGLWSLEIIIFPLSVAAGVARLSAEDLVRALGSSFACLVLTKSQE